MHTIKTSSRLLNDSIDFCAYVKVVTIEWKDQSGCRYINGVVFKKDVAHRSMNNQIDRPKILMIENSLGYM